MNNSIKLFVIGLILAIVFYTLIFKAMSNYLNSIKNKLTNSNNNFSINLTKER